LDGLRGQELSRPVTDLCPELPLALVVEVFGFTTLPQPVVDKDAVRFIDVFFIEDVL
jgi:hypothetical protein